MAKTIVISTAAGLSAGVVGALLIIAIHMRGAGVDAGDILTFFGGIVGTGLAVAGAVWIEDRKRNSEMVEGAKPILDALLVLERQSRPFFWHPGERRKHYEEIDQRMATLDRLLSIAPPRSGRLITLFDRLKFGASFLTCEHYLEMDEEAELQRAERRHYVEGLLELFDTPLKLLIVEYSRLVNPKSSRAVPELGELPEP